MFSTFAILFAITFVIVALFSRTKPHEKVTRERMNSLVAVQKVEESPEVMLGFEAKPHDTLAGKLARKFEKYRAATAVTDLIRLSGAKTTLEKFLLMSAVYAVAAGFVAEVTGQRLAVVIGAVFVGAFVNYGLLKFKAGRRINKFNVVLPDSIELLSRALRAGHAMPSAIEVVAQQSPEPVGPEFAKCAQQQRFGIPFRDVLLNMSHEIPSEDLHCLVTAILVQKETGGDLTEILDRTTEVIRERVRIQGEIRTHTAQGRMTGLILSALPIILLGVINLMSPGYSHVLFVDPLGQKLLYAAGGLIVMGGLVIRNIVNIKV